SFFLNHTTFSLVFRHVLEKFKTREQAKRAIFEYITCFYNGKRIHSSIGYFTPNQYEHMYRCVV
ncbi:IS3 family transposase, partial [Brevibacillus agri]|uniref:IS3 family transposase n=3 Tax=Brevibacillus agri TaxID=51101 RepID=UPI0025B6E8F0